MINNEWGLVMRYSVKKIAKDEGDVFVCGDLHGSYTPFMEHLIKIGFNFNEDLVICVGDLIDRGSENIKCLELIDEDWFESTRGNHELLAYCGTIRDSKTHNDCWYENGGSWFSFMKGTDEYFYAKDLIANTKNLPEIIEVTRNGRCYVVCHADYPRKTYSANTDLSVDEVTDLMWNRDRIYQYLDGLRSAENMTINGAERFFFGHTSLNEICNIGNCTYLDTAFAMGGKIGFVNIDSF